ncbi:PQQ-dependent sugar dehydrogenase [Luteipulveratus mongoliensis]|uniref:Glucose sorbosone dehydrogenase n=1 Tax=Luteipulveratus mongoliensis TaxID=571913 RepID=A0A0K1JL42_9MICO|nr:PQQ-dependent sugar dehydrogenase [Luteipulveratus mongoliensis]AKU17444.1 glucose sorbosone dehydrogenase [Luteipulveratus mongoliensis]
MGTRRIRTACTAAAVAVVAFTGCESSPPESSGSTAGSSASAPAPAPSSGGAPTSSSESRTTVASKLDVPWGLAFLPDRSALLTLRDKAEVLQIREGAKPVSVGKIDGVEPNGEGGLLGIAVSPQFASDKRVFVYYTTGSDNRVERFTFDGKALHADRVILQGIPNADHHNGGRLEFGPDGRLYIGTGDAGETSHSQDTSSLGGKILRVDQDGNAPTDNPNSGSPVWSWGHRNVQGLAWDSAGRMFASEFGQNTWDELNLIRKGANYGWPVVEGKGNRAPYVDPLVQWRTSDSSPSGLAIGTDGAAYMAALAGRALWRVPLNGITAGTPERLLDNQLGRIRTVERASDGRLWIVTSNTFRGSPSDDDDRVIAMRPPL